MQEAALDQEVVIRLAANQTVQMIIEANAAIGRAPYTNVEQVEHAINLLAHTLSNGKDVAVICTDESGKFVR